MLGTEPQVIQDYVQNGRVKLVFWPVLNHGSPSVYATLTAHCAGLQDADLFWDLHERLFTNQGELYAADRDYFIAAALSAGADRAAFEQCYDDQASLDEVLKLDSIRLQRGIANQPMFDVGGTIYAGAPSYDSFSQVLDAALQAAAD